MYSYFNVFSYTNDLKFESSVQNEMIICSVAQCIKESDYCHNQFHVDSECHLQLFFRFSETWVDNIYSRLFIYDQKWFNCFTLQLVYIYCCAHLLKSRKVLIFKLPTTFYIIVLTSHRYTRQSNFGIHKLYLQARILIYFSSTIIMNSRELYHAHSLVPLLYLHCPRLLYLFYIQLELINSGCNMWVSVEGHFCIGLNTKFKKLMIYC